MLYENYQSPWLDDELNILRGILSVAQDLARRQ